MKDFQKLQEICLKEVRDAGIIPGDIAFWTINRRAKRRWGYCKEINGRFTIEIAERLLTDDRISEKDCKTTMIHEILHTCKDSMKHTGEWKRNAERMNALYGYKIKRLTSGEEKGVENYHVKHRPVAYRFRCKRCHFLVERRRACKFTRYYKNYICPVCGARRTFEKQSI